MYISVIIPTYNRANILSITVNSFINQDYPKHKFEIIVADNNSTDHTKKIIEELQAVSAVKIKYLFEGKQGVHFARNSAAKIASFDLLYFTDDDMVADQNLLKEIIEPFLKDEKVGSATGKVLPKWEITPPVWILKLCQNTLLSLNDMGDGLRIEDYDLGVFSCHQAMRREAFFKSGGFNPENTAGNWIGDGETGLNIKIKELGYKFAYNGKSIIYHIIPPNRMTQKYLNNRLRNQGNSDSYTYYKKYKPDSIRLIFENIKKIGFFLGSVLFCIVNFLFLQVNWRIWMARCYYFIAGFCYNLKLIKSDSWRNLVLRNNWLDE